MDLFFQCCGEKTLRRTEGRRDCVQISQREQKYCPCIDILILYYSYPIIVIRTLIICAICILLNYINLCIVGEILVYLVLGGNWMLVGDILNGRWAVAFDLLLPLDEVNMRVGCRR